MKTESVNVADLMLDPSNVRKHSTENLEAIKASLSRCGQQKPIVVDMKGVVVAGNGQLMAAKELGWKKIEIVRTKLEGANMVAYAIADNRTAELAEWDSEALEAQLKALSEDLELYSAVGFDLPVTNDDVEAVRGEEEAEAERMSTIVLTYNKSEHYEVSLALSEMCARNSLSSFGSAVRSLLGLSDTSTGD